MFNAAQHRCPISQLESLTGFDLGSVPNHLGFCCHWSHFGHFASTRFDLADEIIIAEPQPLNLLLYFLPIIAKRKTESLAALKLFAHLVIRQQAVETLFGHGR
jgi:hypothetical protein